MRLLMQQLKRLLRTEPSSLIELSTVVFASSFIPVLFSWEEDWANIHGNKL
jgi:hypothetical protein